MSTPRDQMIARMRAAALASNVQRTQDTCDEVEYVHDDEPGTHADAEPEYSPARDRMLQRYLDERDQPVETGE